MGLFDTVFVSGPDFVCPEGHPIKECQTKDLGATMGTARIEDGRFTFEDGGWGGVGDSEFDPPAGPLTRAIEVYAECRSCPAFVQVRTLNLVAMYAVLRVDITEDRVTRVTRIGEDLPAFLARVPAEPWLKGCHGPVPYEEAYAIHCGRLTIPGLGSRT